MEQQTSPISKWVESVQDEIDQIVEKIEYLDDQGRVDFTLAPRLNELKKQIDKIKRMKAEDE